jgi:hypothetical protein
VNRKGKEWELDPRPLPRGEGGPRPALSPAGAGRVRGQLHGENGPEGKRNELTPPPPQEMWS